jgi:hypothetical protein
MWLSQLDICDCIQIKYLMTENCFKTYIKQILEKPEQKS